MTPYYDDGQISLYHGDCREMLPDLAADVIVTDPPYGVGMAAFNDDFSLVGALNQSTAMIAVVFISPRRVIDLAANLDSWAFNRLLWMHKSADLAAPWRGWCMNSESIALFSRTGARWPKPQDYRTDMYSTGPWERAGHPNGKPLAVVRDLVRRTVGNDQCVIDPFLGSGTTLVAAKELGRRAIGIEIEERYCEIAARRLQQSVMALEVA